MADENDAAERAVSRTREAQKGSPKRLKLPWMKKADAPALAAEAELEDKESAPRGIVGSEPPQTAATEPDWTQPDILAPSGAEAVESKMPSTGNNCLLHSLGYNGAPRGSDMSDASMRALREAIAATAIAYRDYDLNGKTLEGWVWATAGMDLNSWAADFVANDTMSDHFVLRIWPFFRGEAVWVWQPSRAGGYEHHGVYRFGAPTGKHARHVLYRPAQLHYNALQVIRPAALERPVASVTPTARPRWVQQRSHRAAEQEKPPPLTLANCDEDTSTAKSTVVEKTAVMASVPHRRWSNMCSSASLPTLNDLSSGGHLSLT